MTLLQLTAESREVKDHLKALDVRLMVETLVKQAASAIAVSLTAMRSGQEEEVQSAWLARWMTGMEPRIGMRG